jgi:general secretion pathway protein D
MKFLLRCLLRLMWLLPFYAFPQSGVEDIFADLEAFEPSFNAQAEPQPAEPQEPVPETVRPAAEPAPEKPVVRPAAPVLSPPYPPQAPSFSAPVAPPPPETPKQVDIEKAVADGKAAFAAGKFDRAQGLFEAVLRDDPYNSTALFWLKRIAGKQSRLETRSYQTTRARMLADVQSGWNTPKAEGEHPQSEPEESEPTEAEEQAAALRRRLESIRIPALSFQDADIQQVVLELSALCRKLDPQRKGVNLVAFGTTETLLPPITFSGSDLSALETLDVVTQMSGMKYEIAPNLVSLTPVNYEPPQQMISREFDVMPSVGNKMMLRLGGSPAGPMDVREFFSTVPFPPGASAQYNPEFNLLLASNAPKYLDRIEALLDRYNRKALDERSRQVEIETKFIEVAQGTLEELGFEWTLGTPGENITSDTWTLPGGQKLFTDTLRSGDTAFGQTLDPATQPNAFNRYAGTLADPTGSGLVDAAGELLVKKIKGDLRIDLLIRALERQAGSDLLSAPKILTKSGETASIHVGEVHWFPTGFDLEIEREAQPVLIPLDYEEERTGVLLEVTPELDPENGTINMKLSPEIRELAGFDQQHVATLWPFFNSGGTSANALDLIAPNLTGPDVESLLSNQQGAADRLIARRPVFRTRKVDTSITIDDGSTIAMGGLIKEKLETFKDSVPVLGKIPLLGRLFRSEGERSTKRNLLIFVTANQVDASGYKKNAR